MPRLHRRGLDEQAAAQAVVGVTSFDSDKPWDWIWKDATNNANFWRKELEEPGMLILAKSAPMGTMIDGDAMISDSTARSINTQTERVHSVKDGRFETNRKGTPLCPGFQNGTCKDTAAGARCARDWSFAHQCALCLSPTHGADICTSTDKPSPPKGMSKGNISGGKSVGKSKKGGKGGGKGW